MQRNTTRRTQLTNNNSPTQRDNYHDKQHILWHPHCKCATAPTGHEWEHPTLVWETVLKQMDTRECERNLQEQLSLTTEHAKEATQTVQTKYAGRCISGPTSSNCNWTKPHWVARSHKSKCMSEWLKYVEVVDVMVEEIMLYRLWCSSHTSHVVWNPWCTSHINHLV